MLPGAKAAVRLPLLEIKGKPFPAIVKDETAWQLWQWLDYNNKKLSEFAMSSNLCMSLPSDCEKVGDLPQTGFTLVIQDTERHPRASRRNLVPVTVVVDIVTAPVQAVGYCIALILLSGGM